MYVLVKYQLQFDNVNNELQQCRQPAYEFKDNFRILSTFCLIATKHMADLHVVISMITFNQLTL